MELRYFFNFQNIRFLKTAAGKAAVLCLIFFYCILSIRQGQLPYSPAAAGSVYAGCNTSSFAAPDAVSAALT